MPTSPARTSASAAGRSLVTVEPVGAPASVGGGVGTGAGGSVGSGPGVGGTVMAKSIASRKLPTESLPEPVLIARKASRVHVCPAGTV